MQVLGGIIAYLIKFVGHAMPLLCVGGTLIMAGNLMMAGLFTASARDYTPEGRAGAVQSVKMVIYIVLPMVLASILDPVIIRAVALEPTAEILAKYPSYAGSYLYPYELFLGAAVAAVFIFLPASAVRRDIASARAEAQGDPRMTMLTKWGAALDRSCPLPEYPRPQLRRESFYNLNGVWDYAVTPSGDEPEVWDGEIVPFSPEAPLSGAARGPAKDEYLHYRRGFTLPEGFQKSRVLLHFGAVDQIAEVFVNGVSAAKHSGGYWPFSADITSLLREGENILRVTVRDNADDHVRSPTASSAISAAACGTPRRAASGRRSGSRACRRSM